MSQSTVEGTPKTGLPGSRIVTRIRRLMIVAALAAFAYGASLTGSKGYCPGGMNSDGTFLDADGNVTEVAPSCITLVLRPSGLIYVAIIAIVIGVLTRMLRRSSDEVSAVRSLDRAAAAIAILVVVSIIISWIWFRMIPITDWDGTGTIFAPFPFGTMDVTITRGTTG
ncbi:hypothetical protein [Microbacterium murale]|uniref:Uncharacterized protein n=1 Tax=Microbacterium murale TaxID=1081040 RepID=A0ABQ1RKZ0_9MICO|nr:hypothetical protein [Microbacterium murale]GGD74015.1 hypothetical protein GCM10007269_16360 [Microbacterium murale]